MDIREAEINRYLDGAGIKHSYIGYRYLITAVRLGIDAPQELKKITQLYENIALIHKTDAKNIERTIRYAIAPFKVTNKEFISRAVDFLKCGLSCSGSEPGNKFVPAGARASRPSPRDKRAKSR